MNCNVPGGFNVPDEAVRYILFQRTAYLRLPVTSLYRHLFQRLPFETPLYNPAVAVESRVARDRVKTLYQRDMLAEFDTFREALPDGCAAILDIGCGVGGIDVLLDRHYRPRQPLIYLLDRTETSRRIYYLMRRRPAFYNSLVVARDLLRSNGIPEERIHLVAATDRFDIPVKGRKFDLIISLLSWGFHYPVESYLDQAADRLTDTGRIILDIRRGTGGVDVLRRRFASVEVVWESEKFRRVAASF
ncbi:hypothetical protein BH23CHL2_BH23CHL2_31160 [soil metagenome]